MQRSKVEEYVDHASSIIEQSPQMDEENTKAKVIRPLIELLGWDIYSSVELEFPVQMGSTKKKVDYALILDDLPVVFIEVKGADSSVSDSDKEQLQSYMRQRGVDWGILTNGKKFHFLKRKRDTERPEEIPLGEFRLEELKAKYQTLEVFSKENIESGESRKIAKNIESVQEAVSKLKSEKDKIAEEVQKTVVEEIGDISSRQIKETSKEFINNLISSLETQTPLKSSGEIKQGESREGESGPWEPRKGGNAISGTISRDEIEGNPDSTVAVFASRESGIEFLKENNAWGFVRLGREPEYASIYLKSESKVKYFAEVEKIVPANQAKLARPADSYVEEARFDPNKNVVFFKPDTLKKLENPIPYRDVAPQGRIYTTLEKFKTADTTQDIL